MARINTYAIDNNVTAQDKWIGTDSAGSITKNFTPEGVANWINALNAVGVAGQVNFKFQSNLTYGRTSGTVSFDAGGGNLTNFSDVTTMKFSKYGANSKLIIDFLQNLVGSYILLCQVDDTNNFGIYTFDSLTQDLLEPDFYTVGLTVQSYNGRLEQNEYYGIVAYPASSIAPEVGHYTHTQIAASSSWSVTHNLGKFPSVSIVDSGNHVVIGDVEYINSNELIITFTSAFSGKAYLN